MENSIPEISYPVSFREEEAKALGKHLKNNQSVVLIGMKRVGISNFLRFFLFHKKIQQTYIGDGKKHLFIPVDLNDLVEREVFPFWSLTLKRIVDAAEKADLPENVLKQIETLFLDSIQSKDLFLLIDNVRKALKVLTDQGFEQTLFFLRFDRITDAASAEFFANLQGLKSAMHTNLTYVFTSFRPLPILSPTVFSKSALSVFSQDMYIKPATKADMETIYETYQELYKLTLPQDIKDELIALSNGYVQYLQLALIILHDNQEKLGKTSLQEMLLNDERITLQSEELWENLSQSEQHVLQKIIRNEPISEDEMTETKYLWQTGMVQTINGKADMFSPLFATYVSNNAKGTQEVNQAEFSKKEHLLFTFLKNNLNEICEREKIIEAIWPEVEAFGVTDWAIDRLVARVRSKLKKQKSPFEIVTVRTRGYKLISNGN